MRQLLGAANIEGSPLFHVTSGNLGYQVEHHLYPDMPSTRYAEIAPRVREICERYELPYNTGPFLKQLGMVQRTILRLAFPGGKERPKPGPYKGEKLKGSGEQTDRMKAAAYARPARAAAPRTRGGAEQPHHGLGAAAAPAALGRDAEARHVAARGRDAAQRALVAVGGVQEAEVELGLRRQPQLAHRGEPAVVVAALGHRHVDPVSGRSRPSPSALATATRSLESCGSEKWPCSSSP